MKKSIAVIIITIIILVVIIYAAYTANNEQKSVSVKRVWVEKTINKELMETDADCGIASVKMLLGYYGIDVSYEEIGMEINTSADGTKWKDIKGYLNTLDNVVLQEYKGNFNKAKEYTDKGYPLFICWDVDKNPEWSHYSILISIDNYTVWMLDPEEKKSLSEYNLDYFLPCWEKENFWFCILEVDDRKTVNRDPITDNESKEKLSISGVQIPPDSLEEYLTRTDTNDIDWMEAGMPIKASKEEPIETRIEILNVLKKSYSSGSGKK